MGAAFVRNGVRYKLVEAGSSKWSELRGSKPKVHIAKRTAVTVLDGKPGWVLLCRPNHRPYLHADDMAYRVTDCNRVKPVTCQRCAKEDPRG